MGSVCSGYSFFNAEYPFVYAFYTFAFNGRPESTSTKRKETISFNNYQSAIANCAVPNRRLWLLYSAGVYLSLGMDAPDFNRVFISIRSWTFTCLFRLNAIEPAFYLAFNFVPVLIILIVVLLNSYKQALDKDHPQFKVEP